jgi:23S rRNA pseudouridine1911/1915/1917 synthase
LSRTAYRVLGEKENMSLLEIELLTGRKHQIRVHMADGGHPVVGDRKYGEENDSNNRMALHALSISFMHPKNGRECFFETKVPSCFNRFMPLKKAE